MLDQSDLQRLTIASISDRCAQETALFFQHRNYDPRYCYELFRRAIVEHNQHAWTAIYAQYRLLVAGWIQRHPTFESSGEEADYFANRAFEKMWVSLTSARFENFSDLKSLLRYLQMCTHSVLVDHSRASGYEAADVDDEGLAGEITVQGPTTEDQAFDEVNQEGLWRWLEERLHDEKERRVMYGSFMLALKPRELYSQFPNAFADVDEVYRIKQNIIARLRRDPELNKILGIVD
jgi:DNA-directed RNA polymerase specialized sigma24 family protein